MFTIIVNLVLLIVLEKEYHNVIVQMDIMIHVEPMNLSTPKPPMKQEKHPFQSVQQIDAKILLVLLVMSNAQPVKIPKIV